MADHHGRFAWYELITTDVAAAQAFYTKVVGWGAQDASTPGLPYTVFTAGTASVGGLMDLPDEATRKWARRQGGWGMSASRTWTQRPTGSRRLGGAVYVPPTNSNIGRISVVADPQDGNAGVGQGLENRPTAARRTRADRGRWAGMSCSPPTGRRRLLSMASCLAGREPETETGPADAYQVFSTGGQADRRHFDQAVVGPDPVLALLLQCRRHRRGRGARDHRGWAGLRGPG